MPVRRLKGPVNRKAVLLAAETRLGAPWPPASDGVAVGLFYPNSYRVGMASLGYQLVWGIIGRHGGFTVERYFSALEGRTPARGGAEPKGLEANTPLRGKDVIAFSAYYEPDYFRIVGALAAAGVRAWAAERGEYDPFVIIGGPAVTANPEPLAPFADAIILGDAEASLPAALDVLADGWGGARYGLWERLAPLEGVYVPPLYRAVLGTPGTPARLTPTAGAPAHVGPAFVQDLSPSRGASWAATRHAEFGKTLLLEPIRGCGRNCSFCEMAVIGKPVRRRRLEALLPALDEAGAAGVRKVGLVGAALSDYDDILALAEEAARRGFEVAASSLALAAPNTPALIKILARSGQRTVTLAPEAATAEGRRRRGKPLPDGRLEEVVTAAAAAGIKKLKLYYIVGVLGEGDDEAAAIGAELAALAKRFRSLSLEARVNPLVPKRGTAYAGAPFVPRPAFQRLLKLIRTGSRGVTVGGGSWREAELQVRLGLGDRGVARWLETAATANKTLK